MSGRDMYRMKRGVSVRNNSTREREIIWCVKGERKNPFPYNSNLTLLHCYNVECDFNICQIKVKMRRLQLALKASHK